MADIPHPHPPPHDCSPDGDDFERLLFESARHDAVPEASRRRVGLALGIGPALPPQPGPGAANVNAGQQAASAAAAAQGKLALLTKSALLGLAGGSLALAVVLRSGDAPPVSAPTPIPIPSLAAPRVTPPEVAPRGAPLASSPAEAAPAPTLDRAEAQKRPSTGREPSRRRRAGSLVRDAAPAESRLLAEVRQLDAARDALAVGNPSQALADIARYRSEFPSGTLELDATLLEVRALDRAGKKTDAHRLAKRVLSRPGTDRYRAELSTFVNPLASGSSARRRDIEEAR